MAQLAVALIGGFVCCELERDVRVCEAASGVRSRAAEGNWFYIEGST